MNYLAHGWQCLVDPWRLAGTAVPDWLRVSDRQVRIRSRRIAECREALDAVSRRMADGILQHLADDDAFHRLPAFMHLEVSVSRLFREQMPDPFDHRPPFLGHIVTELLLDAVLAERDSSLLPRYYAALATIDPREVELAVNQLTLRPAVRLAEFIQQFRVAQFLYDYADDEGLLRRLNQVLRRVTLPPLDVSSTQVLREARRQVNQQADALLGLWTTQSTSAVADSGSDNDPGHGIP
jgi:hypothetical protein